MRPSHWADWLMALSVRVIALSILIASLVAASASFLYNKGEEADQARRVAMQVNMRLHDQLALLEGVRALFQSDQATSGPGIRAYLEALQPQVRAPGMQGIGIAIAIQQASPATAEQRIRENYGDDIKVWPATTQPVGFPIVLLEPNDPRNHAALGYDMYSEPVRREAMRRAWQTGQPAATGIVQLVQEIDEDRKQPGFLIYVPVYAAVPRLLAAAAGETGAGETSRLESRPIEAFVYAPFRIDDLMIAIFGSQLKSIAGIEIHAGEGPAARKVFARGSLGWDAHEERLHIADRQWTMRISYGRLHERLGRPFGILLFGLALALLATKLHSVQRRRLHAFQVLAAEKARHAEDRELMMGELAHRMKNAFARIGALARITIRESSDLADFETRFDGRLRALSDAKQMLVTGEVESVELGRIMRRELDLAGVPKDRLAIIEGPLVRLDDEGAQALALAIHELVTNSIKYGALAGKGTLEVGWERRDGDIILSWEEKGLPTTPEIDRESFGTQFIRSLIERQLKGSWQRSAADHSLSVVIRWPDRGRDA